MSKIQQAVARVPPCDLPAADLPLRSQRTEVVGAMIKPSKLGRGHSLPAVTLEFSKLRRMEMLDGTFVTGEVTRKQRKIVEALGLDLERLCD